MIYLTKHKQCGKVLGACTRVEGITHGDILNLGQPASPGCSRRHFASLSLHFQRSEFNLRDPIRPGIISQGEGKKEGSFLLARFRPERFTCLLSFQPLRKLHSTSVAAPELEPRRPPVCSQPQKQGCETEHWQMPTIRGQ